MHQHMSAGPQLSVFAFAHLYFQREEHRMTQTWNEHGLVFSALVVRLGV